MKILEEGKAFELSGIRWHINCFRCHLCSTLLDASANLLLLGDGLLICDNCTYSCHSCHQKIEELAILTGDQAYCAACFRCRNCKRKIENLRYARTTQGIFCMNCHESLMARRRKKAKAAAQSKAKEKDGMLVDKSLPALPPSAVPQSAFSPAMESPGDIDNDTPTELSPRPRTNLVNDSASRSSSRRPQSPERLHSDLGQKESLTLPTTTYRNNRQSQLTSTADNDENEGELLPLALDPSPALSATPRQEAASDARGNDRDYLNAPKSNGRQVMREQDGSSQASTPHIAFQEKGRTSSSEYAISPKESPRKTSQTQPSSDTKSKVTADNAASGDKFRLQEAPKTKKSMSRSASESEQLSSSTSTTVARKEVAGGNARSDYLSTDNGPSSRTSQDTRPSMDSTTSRSDSKQITRKEIATGRASAQDSPSSSSSSESPISTPTVNGKTISGPLLSAPVNNDDPALPTRAAGRPGPPQHKISDSFMAPRAPPAPPVSNHRSGKASVSSAYEQPASPSVLPRWSSGGDFTMDADMARILGDTEESNNSKSIMRRVSNAVRHGRKDSEHSVSGRAGHSRSISETTRGAASPRWPKTPLVENGDGIKNISSPISLSSPNVEDPGLLRRQLRNSEQRVLELEREMNAATDLKGLHKKLIEKRQTVTVLDGQAEMMIAQIEALTDTVAEAKKSGKLSADQVQEKSLEEFKRKIEKFKDSISVQIEALLAEREALEQDKDRIVKERDRALVEFEQLSMKNSQLADLNNDLTNQIQARFKDQTGAGSSAQDSSRTPPNGLGIYTHHNKAKSNTSMTTDDISLRPSTGTTLQGSSISNATYPHIMEPEQGLEPATVIVAPHVVNMKRVQGKKFNWKGSNVKAAAKGFKAAFSTSQQAQERNQQWPGQLGDNIGLPYDATSVPIDSPSMLGSVPRSGSQDPSRQGGFGLFKKTATMPPRTFSSGNITPITSEPPTKLFGSYLEGRADYERAQIPSIVTRCIEEVQLRGMDVEGIYRKTGGSSQVKVIQDGFENSVDYDDISDPDVDIIAVTSALKQYFRKLPNPLITFEVYDRVIASKGKVLP